MERLLITGAAGALGQMLRARLGGMAKTLRLSDIAEMAPAGPGEEVIRCDLADGAAVAELVAGCDGIVHLGGISVERNFDLIEAANLRGVYNLYEAARLNGLPRIIFASSNHTVGFHTQSTRLTASDPFKPDSLYGVSKIFGEAIASLYHSKFGQESALVRIGSCTDEPKDWRALGSWFSHDDFVRLIEHVFMLPRLGCPVIWGASDNDARWWDDAEAAHLGWKPKDNAGDHLPRLLAEVPAPDRDHPTLVYQGGIFTTYPIYHE